MAKNLYNLTAVTTVNDSDLLHVNQGSVSSDKKVTKANLLKEVNSSITSINNSLANRLVDVSAYFAINTALSPTGYNSRVFYDPYTHSVRGSFFLLTDTQFGTTTNMITISNATYRPSSTKSIMGLIRANGILFPYSGNVYSDGGIRQSASGVCTGAWFTFEYDV